MHILYGFLIGLLASVLSGMFGIGGAIVTTPAIRVLLGTSPSIALGTPLPLTIPSALSGSFRYYREGLLKFNVIAPTAAMGILGSVGGSLLTGILNLNYLMLATGVVILYVSGVTVFRGIKGKTSQPPEEDEENSQTAGGGGQSNRSLFLTALTGTLGGFVSGLLGIGGGMVFVPSFMYILDLPIKMAFANSLAVIALVAIPGTIIHAILGHVSGWLFLAMLAGALPGGFIGASLSIRIKDRYLYILFGTLLAAFGIIFIVNEIKCIIS